MDKRIFAAALAALMTGALTACSGVRSESGSSQEPTTAPTEAATEEATEQETSAATEAVTTAAPEETTTAAEASQEETTAAAQSADEGLFPADDAALIAKAQEMFDLACKTEWDFTVGPRYELDMNTQIENQYSWPMYLITTPGISSMKDIRNDYHTVFSVTHADGLDEMFAEQDGKAYSLSVGRGGNIFYESSEITGIQSRSENEVVFSVVNHMNGSDFGDGPVDEQDTFSLVAEDGALKVGQFRLPY